MAISHNYKNDAAISTVKPNVQAINELKRVSRKKWRSFVEKATLAACVTLPATVVLYAAAIGSNSRIATANITPPVGVRAVAASPVLIANPTENREIALINKKATEARFAVCANGKFSTELSGITNNAIVAILLENNPKSKISPWSVIVSKRMAKVNGAYRNGNAELNITATTGENAVSLTLNKNQINAINNVTSIENATTISLINIMKTEEFFLEKLKETVTSGLYASPKNGIEKMEINLDNITEQADALKSQVISAQRKEVNKILTDYERAKGILPKNLRS